MELQQRVALLIPLLEQVARDPQLVKVLQANPKLENPYARFFHVIKELASLRHNANQNKMILKAKRKHISFEDEKLSGIQVLEQEQTAYYQEFMNKRMKSFHAEGLKLMNQRLLQLNSPNELLLLPAPPSLPSSTSASASASASRASKKCYICRHQLFTCHTFYGTMCKPCGDLNFLKRNQRFASKWGAGKVAIVTGGRIKIGFEIVCKLLRDGFRVITTSRFVQETKAKYDALQDSKEWISQLTIIAVDFRMMESITTFCNCVQDLVKTKIDILIHNAAQTKHFPPAYYKDTIAMEFGAASSSAASASSSDSNKSLVPNKNNNNSYALQLALLSMIPTCHADRNDDNNHAFNEITHDGVPKDDRKKHTWNSRFEDIEFNEVKEAWMINVFAPWCITKALLPLLKKLEKDMSFVMNVSAVEGQFYTHTKVCASPTLVFEITMSYPLFVCRYPVAAIIPIPTCAKPRSICGPGPVPLNCGKSIAS
jgi:NAD(P)-dependent dehydrogenase (short-subunit alcohol dehydrogenase family)